MRRWFIEYNPLYPLSAMLVLAGTTLISHAVSQESLPLGGIVAGGVAELYALALIGGVAFLTKIEQHRPAALLALLAVLYQCDLTLQVETYAYYGGVGELASLAWVMVFAGKLYALGRALRLRLSLSVFAAPLLGAIGLAATPHLAYDFDPQTRTSLVSLWIFAVGALGLWTSRRIGADFELDVRARRAIVGTWVLWGVAIVGHTLFWVGELRLEGVGLLPPLALLASRWLRRERAVWLAVALVLAGVGALSPEYLSMSALMAAGVFALRALRRPVTVVGSVDPARPAEPYRTPGGDPVFVAPPPEPVRRFVRATGPALGRLMVGVLVCNYVSVWTHGWQGGAAPEHILWLDLAFVVASVGLFGWARARIAALPALATLTHLGAQVGWLVAPRGALQVGATAVALGFVVLLGSLLVSWHLGRTQSPAADPPLRGAGRPARP